MRSAKQSLVTKFLALSSLVASVVSFDIAAVDTELSGNQEQPSQWQAVSDSQLSLLRGGFVLPNGVIVNISIEKLVFNNGVEVYKSYFQSPANQRLIDNGELNFTTELNSQMFQTIIQNNLDNQTIQSLKTINIEIKNLNVAPLNLTNHEYFTRYVFPYTHN